MPAEVPRAPRVAMDASMLIRRSGDAAWRHARTINISRTGVLLQTDGLFLEPQTDVEITVTLPALGSVVPSRIRGRGRIVRTLELPFGDTPVMAACLDDYQVQNDGAPA